MPRNVLPKPARRDHHVEFIFTSLFAVLTNILQIKYVQVHTKTLGRSSHLSKGRSRLKFKTVSDAPLIELTVKSEHVLHMRGWKKWAKLMT
jgi:hypothetical protein